MLVILYCVHRVYVELQILLLAQHVSGTTMPIIRSSRVLYSGCCLWYFVLWFSSCWCDVELRVMCPVCGMLLIHWTKMIVKHNQTHLNINSIKHSIKVTLPH